MKKLSVEFKVGFFVLIAITILCVLIFQIGGVNIFNAHKYTLFVIFDFVSGVSKDAPVHVAGVSVGEVKNVDIFYNSKDSKTQVKLELRVDKGIKIPKDSMASINTLGILGEKYVEIVPGKDRVNFLKDGNSIIGNNPVQMEKLTESLVDVVGDQTVRDSLRESFYNLRVTSENLRQMTQTMNELATSIKKGKGTLGKFISDDSIYTETEKMIVNMNKKLDKTITDLNHKLNDLIGDLKKHPWKIFQKPPRVSKKKISRKNDTSLGQEEQNTEEKKDNNKGVIFKQE